MCDKTGSTHCDRVEFKLQPVAVLIGSIFPLQQMDHLHVVVVLPAHKELQGTPPLIVVVEVSDSDSLE
jgi:hypothetical protein